MSIESTRAYRPWALDAVYRLRNPIFWRYSFLVCVFLLFALAAGAGAWSEWSKVPEKILERELVRLRENAIRTAGRMEALLLLDTTAYQDLSSFGEIAWLRREWQEKIEAGGLQYAALINPNGIVVAHSDPTRQNQKLEPHWYEQRIYHGGGEYRLTYSKSNVLSAGAPVYDLEVAIIVGEEHVGSYHVGLASTGIDQNIDEEQDQVLYKWLMLALGIALVLSISLWSLWGLARETTVLRETVALSRTQRLTELGRLAGGLAHEIRNPLNAIRLNLFTLEKKLQEQDFAAQDEMQGLLQEVNLEVGRLESLVRSVLGYASPQDAEFETLDLNEEVDSFLAFLKRLLEKERMEIIVRAPRRPVLVHINRDCFRQIMLNLMNNARDAVREEGTILINIRKRSQWAEIEIIDDGPGIPIAEQKKIFDPFFTTKETGFGLGLALVKRFVEEHHGHVECESNGYDGALFRVRLPLVNVGPRRRGDDEHKEQ